MILQIDDLVIPETLSGNAEKFNTDSHRRTASMRLITKLSINEKWRVTLNYEGRVIPSGLRTSLYNKCREMRIKSAPVTFVSPYDGLTYTTTMKCVNPLPPKVLSVRDGMPLHYSNCGAVFEEV